ncbi:MAG TPA: hypothetical protein ENJ18_14430, partial [Nannocystis exedens]|nr:hypothetical protein [Nannocystis exedens]
SGPGSSASDGETGTSSGGNSASEGGSSGSTGPTSESSSSSSGSTSGSIPPNCGDGMLDADEQCDEGASNGLGQACNLDCTLNTCGDGVQSPTEECDEGELNGPDDACSKMCTVNPSSCGVQEYEAMLEASPVDIIIVIDNSGSMGKEIKGVQDNININFAAIIDKSGLDYRVIMVSEHGPYDGPESICIEAPLSGIPAGGCDNPPAEPVNNPGIFYHYSVPISSHNAWCQLIDTFDGSKKDQFDLGPNGWQEWLREESVKTFIAISDDGSKCGPYNDKNNANGGVSAASLFDEDLQALSPLHFGDSPENRNYLYYSIVAMGYNDPPSEPYTPKDPIILTECPTAADPGTGHQAMSNLSEALRFPICDTTSYDVIFSAIADGVIKNAKIVCDFPLPEPPEDKTLDLETVLVEYTPMGMGEPEVFMQVDSIDQCGPMAFYIEGDTVHLCPEACDVVQLDMDAKIGLQFSCEPINPG